MTKSGIIHSQRDIVLIPTPYTDLKSYKKRPVIIVSCDQYNSTFEGVIVVALTSNPKPVRFSIPLDNSGLEEGRLKAPSIIRPDKIYTLHQNIIIRKFGKITGKVFGQVKESINRVID